MEKENKKILIKQIVAYLEFTKDTYEEKYLTIEEMIKYNKR